MLFLGPPPAVVLPARSLLSRAAQIAMEQRQFLLMLQHNHHGGAHTHTQHTQGEQHNNGLQVQASFSAKGVVCVLLFSLCYCFVPNNIYSGTQLLSRLQARIN